MGEKFHSKLSQIYGVFGKREDRGGYLEGIDSRRDMISVVLEGGINGGAKFGGESSLLEKNNEREEEEENGQSKIKLANENGQFSYSGMGIPRRASATMTLYYTPKVARYSPLWQPRPRGPQGRQRGRRSPTGLDIEIVSCGSIYKIISKRVKMKRLHGFFSSIINGPSIRSLFL